MSSADYVAMRTPKRGLRSTIDGDIHHDDPALWKRSSWGGLSTDPNLMVNGFWQTLLWAPYNDPDSRPSLWTSLVVMILVFLGCLFNGWVLMAAQMHALSVAGDAFIRAILIAAVAGSMFYVTQLWTYESKLPTVVYPEISMAMVPTLRVGVITAALYGVFQYAGYAAAGGILRALNGVVPGTTNVAISANSYWLYWFGGVFIVFNYVYNVAFRQTWTENPIRTHIRASKATALAIFGITVAFYTLGLITYSSGLYVAGVIISGDNAATFAGDSVVPWAYWTFVALLAVPATVGILYVLIGYLTSDQLPSVYRSADGYKSVPAEARIPAGVSKRVASRLEVNY